MNKRSGARVGNMVYNNAAQAKAAVLSQYPTRRGGLTWVEILLIGATGKERLISSLPKHRAAPSRTKVGAFH